MNDVEETVSVCASCGKEGRDVTNTCNKCKQVKYCNAACKKKHRHKHKKECEESLRLAAELLIHDKELFKQPPPAEDCPICFLRMPTLHTGRIYMACCGKVICCGCIHAPLFDDEGNEVDNQKCPFCRTPDPTSDEERVRRIEKRVEAGDTYATYDLGCYYSDGTYGLVQDNKKALEYWHRASELGYTNAYANIGYAYDIGEGVEVDNKKANHYYELAAMGGDATARHNLGINEGEAGNVERALRHHMIAVRAGENDSLKEIKELYTKNGHVTKDDYMKALQLYQAYLAEIKSDQRDEASTTDDNYRYY